MVHQYQLNGRCPARCYNRSIDTDVPCFTPFQFDTQKNAARQRRHRVCRNYLLLFSHCWLATPQEVLQADWQEVWHSPQPPVLTLLVRSRVAIVLIRSIVENLSKLQSFAYSFLYTVLSLCMITRCADSVKIFVALSVKTLQVLTALPRGEPLAGRASPCKTRKFCDFGSGSALLIGQG